MNGVHDMGGMHGFGPVVEEKNEPLFHARWEGRVYALVRVLGFAGKWNIDQSRHTQETLPPHVYLGSSYYERWMRGLERLLLKSGLVAQDEIAAEHALHPPQPIARKISAADVPRMLTRSSYARPATAPAQFAVGDRVRARMINPTTHTRLPRYARGHVGLIEAIRGCHVYPDSTTTGKGDDPQWLYTVVFAGTDLWGPQSDPRVTVSVEAWEPYLEAANA
jgi:nitrile hydratase beta subunit